jgi:hypothetical protein
MRTVDHHVDVCVVGGGLAGLCAAVAAARHGAKTVLMHDRPVLGGNASSEIRVWVQGAFGSWDRSLRETGIVEEIMLETLRLNPQASWSMWDAVLFGLADREPNLTLLLNCACAEGAAANGRLERIKGWQSTSQTWHVVEANLFVDASGDSILAPFCRAELRRGRESRSEFSEPNAWPESSPITMGNSIEFIWRDMGRPVPFVKPDWAYSYPDEASAPRHSARIPEMMAPNGARGCFYVELGGRLDTVHDAEHIRDELLKVGLGIIDHLKNHGDHGAENVAVEWFGMLPGKRESWRYVGDHTLTQNDVAAGTPFPDIVAYGGWPVDDHHPDGSLLRGETEGGFVWHPVNCPYGIPYRSLYSRNVGNLFCAGRNISATHLGLCTTRVMATCAVIGQAVGTAAALAVRHGCSPRQVGERHLAELQATLMDDDCWLPGLTRAVPGLCQEAALSAANGADVEALRNGHDREDEANGRLNAWTAGPGEWAEYRFESPRQIKSCRLIFDSDLKRKFANMPLYYPRDGWDLKPPATLVKRFRLLAETRDGQWMQIAGVDANAQRLVRLPLDVRTGALRLMIEETWGHERIHVFGWELNC